MGRNPIGLGVISTLLLVGLLCCRPSMKYPTSIEVGGHTSPFLGDIGEVVQDTGRILNSSIEQRERFIAVHLKLLESGSSSRSMEKEEKSDTLVLKLIRFGPLNEKLEYHEHKYKFNSPRPYFKAVRVDRYFNQSLISREDFLLENPASGG